MDSSGWTNIEEEDDDGDPTQVLTVQDVINRRLKAQEKAKGKIEERGENSEGWALIPDLVIEKIYEYLSIRDRYSASLACRQWQRAFYMQRTWNTFQMTDTTLARRKYNYYSGWQYRLDHLRTQVCILRVGKYIRNLVLLPVWNLFNIFEFMMLLSYYAERYDQDNKTPCFSKVRSLRFVFWCDMSSDRQHQEQQLIYGTGGDILQSLKRLMKNLKYLQNLELIDLLLEPFDALHLLDEVCVLHTENLKCLTIINVTKVHYNLLHPGVFINLRVLKISPQNLSNEVIEMLCSHGSLEKLYIIQNSYTESAIPVDAKSWLKVEHRFQVFLRMMGKVNRDLIWQECAPVASIVYDCPLTKVTWPAVLTTIEYYNYTLKEYGHLGLPKFTGKENTLLVLIAGSRKFSERADSSLLTLCRKCPYLTTLIIRERISTSTAMLIAGMSPNLKYFHVRANALIKKCDYTFHNMELDYNFTQWIKLHCRSYEKMTGEIAKILGYDWKPLTDSQFKCISQQLVAYSSS